MFVEIAICFVVNIFNIVLFFLEFYEGFSYTINSKFSALYAVYSKFGSLGSRLISYLHAMFIVTR